jgi:hypothetical protein
MKLKPVLGIGSLMLANIASAQTASPAAVPPAVAVIANPSEASTVLRTGTKIPLKMAEELTTKGKKLRVGQRFQLEVAEDIRLGESVVIPAGTPATAEITDVRNKGMWGKSGRINAQLLYMRVNGRQIRLTGSFDDKGVTGTAGVVAAIAFIPVAGFFTTGTSAKLPLGGAVTGFLDEDVTVAFAPSIAPPPLVVTAPVSKPTEAAVLPSTAASVAKSE